MKTFIITPHTSLGTGVAIIVSNNEREAITHFNIENSYIDYNMYDTLNCSIKETKDLIPIKNEEKLIFDSIKINRSIKIGPHNATSTKIIFNDI